MPIKDRAAHADAPERADTGDVRGQANRLFGRDAEKQFRAALATRGLVPPPGGLVADGRIHRCDVAAKGRAGRGDGAYALYVNGPIPAGWFQNWCDGLGVANWWYENGRQLSPDERRELERAAAAAKAEHEKYITEKRERARLLAQRMWRDADDAPADHPYAQAKGVSPEQLRTLYNCLLVPMCGDNDDIENLLFIRDTGWAKHGLRGGRQAGLHFWVNAPPDDAPDPTICVCEGWATGESIYQATKHAVVVAFNCNNLSHVARWLREQYPTARIVLCADDDWRTEGNPGTTKAWEAARAANGRFAAPRFKEGQRQDADTDFNDMLRATSADAVKRIIDGAVAPPFQGQGDTDKDLDVERKVDELAQLDRVGYDRVRRTARRELGIQQSTLDDLVKERRAQRKKATAKPQESPADKMRRLRASAAPIIESDNVLALFEEDFAQSFAGEEKNANLLYLTGTSRLFEEAMHAAIKGPSAAGKSKLRKAVLAFFPPEVVVAFTALSEKALLYMPDDISHKIFAMGEAQDGNEVRFQDYLLRELMSEGILRYPVVQKIDGELVTITIERQGPVAFMVTTTRNKLNPENETRMLSLEVDDSEQQTRDVLGKVASIEGYNDTGNIDLRPWHDYQRWLTAGNCKVKVPFARTLGSLIPPKAVRLRRDFGQLLRAIKAHALLHREHRECDESRTIRATIGEDYAICRALLADTLAEATEVKLRKTVIETTEAVREVQPDEHQQGATVRAIAQALNLDRSAARRRLYAAEGEGLIVNIETREHHTARYRVATEEEQVAGDALLPTVDELRAAIRESKAR
jgi:phage/plasmid primase-like uncharacterized protein